MKTFEEKYTAWVDGKLSEEATTEFEKQLEALSEATTDRADAHRLGDLLRRHGDAPKLTNADFFNHQVLHRIHSQEAATPGSASGRWWRWTVPRLATAGALLLLVAVAMFKMLIPSGPNGHDKNGPPYFAEIVDLWPADPSISATTVYTPQDNVTVVWLEGLDYLPASYVLE